MFWDQEATGPDLIDCTVKTPAVRPEDRAAAGEAPRASVTLTPANLSHAADAAAQFQLRYAEAV
ncbi:hypothetical protein NX862_17435 [Rhodobacter sp. KR11]|uniref:hypothetical protein n=1 Tax=Rhodobacter sp. KR11 TaxID=2974588 RepID=UPI0022231576|nr:hypothetical protein [Rhodobacter sp. KR11]MCW1920544.1 hypothetical protein [Rhodobacter sp. KR11]